MNTPQMLPKDAIMARFGKSKEILKAFDGDQPAAYKIQESVNHNDDILDFSADRLPDFATQTPPQEYYQQPQQQFYNRDVNKVNPFPPQHNQYPPQYNTQTTLRENYTPNNDYVLVSKGELKQMLYETLLEIVPRMTTNIEEQAIKNTIRVIINENKKKGKN